MEGQQPQAVGNTQDITATLTEVMKALSERMAKLQSNSAPPHQDTHAVTTNGRADSSWESEVTCPICFEPFGEHHTPRTVRCGHSVCTPCLETILAKAAGDRNCPECRRPLKVTAVNHIPVSYTILRLSRALEVTSAARAEAEVEESLEGTLVGEVCASHHHPIKWWCSNCQEFQCHSCPHEDNDCPERLPAKEAFIHLKQAQVEETERTVLSLSELKNTFETQRDKLVLAVDHMEENIHQLEMKMKKVQKQVLDVEEAEAIVVEASSVQRMKHALARAQEVQEAAKVWLEHKNSKPASPIMFPGDDPIGMADLCTRVRFTKEMYAVIDGRTARDGVHRYGRLTLEGNKIILHSFDTVPPPATALLVNERCITYTQGEPVTVFLDIHINGRCEGRVVIMLFQSTSTRKRILFIDTCKNTYGKTFKGLPLYAHNFTQDSTNKVVQIGKEIKKFPKHQPYANKQSTDEDNYLHRTIFPGLVSGLTHRCTPNIENSSFPTPCCFLVHLYNLKSENDPKGFGKVLSGLGVLRYAMWDNRDAVIGDCGLVLPLVGGHL